MNNEPTTGTSAASPIVNACWNSIGVQGDGSCPELNQYVHCRNCPVYSAAAMQLLDRDAARDELASRTSHVAQPKYATDLKTESVVVFRIGAEWLALPAACVTEVANLLPIHTLPHRPKGAVLGLASVRGELMICVSLSHVLGVGTAPVIDPRENRSINQRLLLIRQEQVRAVCPVDEVHGILRFHPRELTEVPATVARATATYSRALLSWRGHSVGVLDDGVLFRSLKRSVG